MKKVTFSICSILAALAMAHPATAGERYRDYRDHHGYHERPYDNRRHYRNHDYRGQRYDYQGHWRSWYDFDRYTQRYPHLRQRGHYYHDGAHLMFRSCPPDTDTCFFFSIGR